MTRSKVFIKYISVCCFSVLFKSVVAEPIPNGVYDCQGINYATQKKIASKVYFHTQGSRLKVHWVVNQGVSRHYHSLLNSISSTVFAGAVSNKERDDVGTEKLVFSSDFKEADLTFFTYNRSIQQKNYGKATCKKIDLG